MADMMTYEEVAALAEKLSLEDKRRLAALLLDENSSTDVGKARPSWMDIRGKYPNLMGGEDAQEWINRTRQESDDHRERILRGHS